MMFLWFSHIWVQRLVIHWNYKSKSAGRESIEIIWKSHQRRQTLTLRDSRVKSGLKTNPPILD